MNRLQDRAHNLFATLLIPFHTTGMGFCFEKEIPF